MISYAVELELGHIGAYLQESTTERGAFSAKPCPSFEYPPGIAGSRGKASAPFLPIARLAQ